MNGIHDMGGMQCFGKLDLEDENVLFHTEWEKQVLALTLAMGATGTWNIDQSRSARESLPPPLYLSVGYYRIWLAALENLLVTHGLIDRAELRTGTCHSPAASIKRVLKADTVAATLASGSHVDRADSTTAQFAIGTQVKVRNLHTSTHTRLPAYIRQRTGQIVLIHGSHVFADDHAKGLGEHPQWLYNVRFDSRELWGDNAQPGSVHVDCWQSYLEPAL